MKPLYTSGQIRSAVNDLYRAPGAKGALVAFVGPNARAYLPKDLREFELVCWLKPGCTSPDALRSIKQAGAQIRVSANMHMKVYWSSRGVVVASANMSASGLLDGGLHEVGVALPHGALDVDRLKRTTDSEPLTPQALRKFDRENRAYLARNAGEEVFARRARRPARSFLDWYRMGFDRPQWKWAPYAEMYDKVGKNTREELHEDGLSEPEAWITVPRDYCQPFDWLLCIDLKDEKEPLSWLCPNSVCKLSAREEGWSVDAPVEAAQHQPLRLYGQTPFVLTKQFQAHVRDTLKAMRIRTDRDWNKHLDSPRALGAFLDTIETAMSRRSAQL